MHGLSFDVTLQLQSFLDVAILQDKAQFGTLQQFDPGTDELYIVAQTGFKQDFLDHFRVVKAFDSSACGRAAAKGGTVIIHDINTDIGFAPHRNVALAAGYRSVKSVPIFSSQEKFLGVISTHFREPKWRFDANMSADNFSELREFLESVVPSF